MVFVCQCWSVNNWCCISNCTRGLWFLSYVQYCSEFKLAWYIRLWVTKVSVYNIVCIQNINALFFVGVCVAKEEDMTRFQLQIDRLGSGLESGNFTSTPASKRSKTLAWTKARLNGKVIRTTRAETDKGVMVMDDLKPSVPMLKPMPMEYWANWADLCCTLMKVLQSLYSV